MKHLISIKSLAAVAIALGAFAAASSAHARSDVYFSIGVQVPGVFVQPAPVYVQPAPIYMQPAPIYMRPAPVYVQPPPYYAPSYYRRYRDHDRDGIANIYDRGGPRHQWRQERRYGPYGDLDRDGIVNRRDRDRDGDGVRNRYDRLPNNPYRN